MAKEMTVNGAIGRFQIQLVKPSSLRLHGKPNAQEFSWLKAHKQEIVDELVRREEVAAAAKAAQAEELRAIKAGEQRIEIRYREGSPLSGYTVYGQAAELLAGIGFGKHVSGWGHLIADEIVEALGAEITYQQAVEYMRPAREAKDAREAARQAAMEAAFAEARKTGEPVELVRWSEECNRADCSLDIVIKYAMPDGATKVERIHTY